MKFLEIQKNCAIQIKKVFGSKMPYLGILGCKIEKVLSYFRLFEFLSTINFSYQYLSEVKAYLEPSQTSAMELLRHFFVFVFEKLTRKPLYRSPFLIKS